MKEISEDIRHNIEIISKRISDACQRYERNPNEVKLLMATKTVSAERIITAFHTGFTLMGENKIQEIKSKYDELLPHPHRTHFIGHLQSNKIKEIIKYNVDCVESIDRFDLAEKLNKKLIEVGRTLDIFIQVNTSSEESKFGITPELAIDLVKQVSKLPALKIKGLMTIGLFSAEIEKVRKCFKILRGLRDEISELNLPSVEMNELSMGMSGDFETAIEEGATIVRVGTSIFGSRIYPDSYYWNERSAKM